MREHFYCLLQRVKISDDAVSVTICLLCQDNVFIVAFGFSQVSRNVFFHVALYASKGLSSFYLQQAFSLAPRESFFLLGLLAYVQMNKFFHLILEATDSISQEKVTNPKFTDIYFMHFIYSLCTHTHTQIKIRRCSVQC